MFGGVVQHAKCTLDILLVGTYDHANLRLAGVCFACYTGMICGLAVTPATSLAECIILKVMGCLSTVLKFWHKKTVPKNGSDDHIDHIIKFLYAKDIGGSRGGAPGARPPLRVQILSF